MKLAAVGSNCIDFYNNIDGGKAYPGGGPVNMAVYTLRLGGNASYIGPVGDDVYGKIMLDAIAAKGVDVSHLHVNPGNTAVTLTPSFLTSSRNATEKDVSAPFVALYMAKYGIG